MIAPIGEEFSPPTHPVRNPNRASAYATLYSPPPTHTSSSGANSIRRCCGGERRIMHSPRLTRSKRHSFAARIFTASGSQKDEKTFKKKLRERTAANPPPQVAHQPIL